MKSNNTNKPKRFSKRRPLKKNGNKKSILKNTNTRVTREIIQQKNSIERALYDPTEVNWVDLPSFPHLYGVIRDSFTSTVVCNANGALGIVFIPQFVPPVVGALNATNICYWNGAAYTGISKVVTSATNPMTPLSNTDMLIKVDTGLQTASEMSCIGYRVRVTTAVPFTSSQGSIYGCVRPIPYGQLGEAAWAGTPLATASYLDSFNYTGPIMASSSRYFAQGVLVGNNTLELKYKPTETELLEDLIGYDSSGNVPATNDNLRDMTDNVLFVTIVGAAASQSILIKVDSIYAYTMPNKSALLQTMRNSDDPRMPQKVMYDLEKSDVRYANIIAATGNNGSSLPAIFWEGGVEKGLSQPHTQVPNFIDKTLIKEAGLWKPKLRSFHQHILPGPAQDNPLHYPGHSFLGPGTDLDQQISHNINPIDFDDQLALKHDVDYAKANTIKEINEADHYMINMLDEELGLRAPIIGHQNLSKNSLKIKKIYNYFKDKLGLDTSKSTFDEHALEQYLLINKDKFDFI